MIFAKPFDRLVLEARKTQTRRPVKRTPDGTTLPCRWKVGHDYAIERPTGVPTDARIQITAVRDELLGNIDYAGIRAEGHKTRAAFADAWMVQHDRDWPPIEPCHRCDGAGDQDCDHCYERDPATGEIVGDHPPGCTACPACRGTGEQLVDVGDADVLDRFDHTHACTLVWVVTFELADVGRYLTPAARPAGSVLGYTTNLRNAMPDEPEVIDGFTLRRFADDAHERHTSNPARREHLVKAKSRSVANRIRQTMVAADRDGIDVLEHLAEVERKLEEIDRLRRAA